MEDTDLQDKIDDFTRVLSENHEASIIEAFSEFPTAVIVEYISSLDYVQAIKYLKLIDIEDAGRIFSYLTIDFQLEVFEVTGKKFFSKLFTAMYSDSRADLYQALDQEEQIELMPYLDKKTREDVIVLSAYPPETAGGIMNTDFATIVITMTAQQAIAKIRQDAPSQKMLYYLYVVDEEMQMLGIVTLKDLIMSDPKDIVRDLYTDNYVYALVNEDRENVAHKIEKHDLVAIPVLNKLKQLVGIVSHEEAIDIIRAEQTEDMEKFMGIMPSEDEETYLTISSFQHFKKRAMWVVSLAGIGLISGVIIHKYQFVLEHFIILALYLPMMTATGGNIGSQSATVVIRALSLNQADDSDWFKILFKEFKISFMLSLCVGLLVFIKISFLTSSDLLPDSMNFDYIATIVALAIAVQVISSAIVGAGLPLLVRKLGGDPAVAASPAITTTVDITGLLIYFTIASLTLTN